MADEIKQQEKNGNFVQFYRDNMQAVSKLAGKNATAFQIFMFICEHMDGYNALMASYQVFMDYTDKSKDTIRKAIKYLYDNGFVDILKSGTSNVYIINQDIAWTSYGNQKKYCKFNGKILIAESENKDYFYRHHSTRVKALEERVGNAE
jgi:DNA-binding transcriptional ArsR family regulator